jgi:5-methylthioadenosine/S-adenosylhomocysteine deaminase
MMAGMDILIRNGTILTMDHDSRIIDKGSIAVQGDQIAAVGTSEDLKDVTASCLIDARGGIVMPGLVNTHTHAAMTCFRGLADDLPLMTWLNDHIFPAESKLDAHMVYSGTLLACAEMIRSGITCFCDMYLFEGAVADAAKAAAMRAVVGEVLYDFPSPNYGPIEAGFAYTEALIKKWRGDPLITIAVEPHSPYLCSPKLLQQAAAISQKHSIPLVIHVSETESEFQKSLAEKGRTPVGYLSDLGVLSPNLLACHCVALKGDDISLLKKFDVKVAHNPESNMKLASGVAAISDMIREGVCVGLGTDGCASNNNLDIFSEMDTAAKLHKVNLLDPTVMDAKTVVNMATIQGARALGLGSITGSLEAGKKADIIIIDMDKPHLVPMYSPYSHIAYAVKADDVTTSIINGRLVMEDRNLLTLDIQAVMSAVNRISEKIREG